jgi:hypothetical protein
MEGGQHGSTFAIAVARLNVLCKSFVVNILSDYTSNYTRNRRSSIAKKPADEKMDIFIRNK